MPSPTVLAVLWLSCALHGASAQQQQQRQRQRPRANGGGSGAWTQRIQWEDNGHVFRLLSTGSRYRTPLPVGQNPVRPSPAAPQSHLRIFLLASGRAADPRAQRRSPVPATAFTNSSGPWVASGGNATERVTPSEVQRGGGVATQVDSGSVPSHAAVSLSRADGFARDHPGASEGSTVMQVASDMEYDTSPDEPRAGVTGGTGDPEDLLPTGGVRGQPENSRNSVFYNLYASGNGGARASGRLPQVSGHGTRYFQSGLPDLVPDPYYIQAATYIQHVQMYALRCAAEENCLARHYHSMDAFSHYELLDVSTEQQVAEGHKASFCLEDTTCDPGIHRRYACTAHTQGLGPGCYDTYHANIDCQWIDITDVPPGNYILKVTVNPGFRVQESDFSNNVVRCDLMYAGTHVQTHNCRITSY